MLIWKGLSLFELVSHDSSSDNWFDKVPQQVMMKYRGWSCGIVLRITTQKKVQLKKLTCQLFALQCSYIRLGMLNWCICNRLVYYDKLTPRHSRQLMNTRQCRDTFRLLVVHNLPDSYSDTSHPYWYICTDMPCTVSIRLYLIEFENIFRKMKQVKTHQHTRYRNPCW